MTDEEWKIQVRIWVAKLRVETSHTAIDINKGLFKIIDEMEKSYQ